MAGEWPGRFVKESRASLHRQLADSSAVQILNLIDDHGFGLASVALRTECSSKLDHVNHAGNSSLACASVRECHSSAGAIRDER